MMYNPLRWLISQELSSRLCRRIVLVWLRQSVTGFPLANCQSRTQVDLAMHWILLWPWSLTWLNKLSSLCPCCCHKMLLWVWVECNKLLPLISRQNKFQDDSSRQGLLLVWSMVEGHQRASWLVRGIYWNLCCFDSSHCTIRTVELRLADSQHLPARTFMWSLLEHLNLLAILMLDISIAVWLVGLQSIAESTPF